MKTYWAAEHLYDGVALASLNNGPRLPIMLPMTCNEGYFIDPSETSLSELGLRRADGGPVAAWAPTGYGLAPGHDYLERGLFLAMFHDGLSPGGRRDGGEALPGCECALRRVRRPHRYVPAAGRSCA